MSLKVKEILRNCPRALLLYYAVLGLWIGTTAMHIPDGYLSPITSIVFFVMMIPFWYVGLKKMRGKLNARSAPLIALLAAFSFVIMMFNIPLPGGTTGHAVGGALAAIILGPVVAVIAISIALIIQAFFFGDGGILTIGANCFNMAVVLPFISYAIYQIIAGNRPADSRRRTIGAFLAGYIGLAAAAFFTAVEFGIQPALFHTADGTPLYAPYPLSVALPAMMISHLLIAAVVEGLATALIILYLQKTNQDILTGAIIPQTKSISGIFHRLRGLWIGLAVLIVATPIGLLAPGTAWGEWGAEELSSLGLGFIPSGLEQLGNLWSAPMPGYDMPALANPYLAYIISAIVGIIIVAIVTWLLITIISANKLNSGDETTARSG